MGPGHRRATKVGGERRIREIDRGGVGWPRRTVVLSPDEVRRFLCCLDSVKHRATLTTCYGAGLRVSEAVCLKTTDIDSRRKVIRVAQGKGQKDRYVMLSPKLLDTLRSYWREARPKDWLFPGNLPGQPITRFAVACACEKARRRLCSSGTTRSTKSVKVSGITA
jgi:integrase